MNNPKNKLVKLAEARQALKQQAQVKGKKTFAQLENLIHLARQAKDKKATQHYQKKVRQKEQNWVQGLLKGQAKLRLYQQKQRWKKDQQARQQQAQQAKKTRLQEIYAYWQKELFRKNRVDKLATGWFRTKKEFLHDKSYETLKLNRAGSNYLIKKTNQSYQEEVNEQKSQIRYWQEHAGLTKIQATNLIRQGQRIKLFFPAKGEHQEFWAKNKEFKQLWAEISAYPGQLKQRQQLAQLSQALYQKSPWRIRDRWPLVTPQPKRSFNLNQTYQQFVSQNHDSHTRKHYFRAINDLLRQTKPRGELVPDAELELDKYGKPRLKEGQVLRIDSQKPGRNWSVYRQVPSLEKVVEQEVHQVAQEGYLREYGTELEIRTWQQKKAKALCWIEAVLGESCSANQGTSSWWCLECIYQGPYHPPVLPIHCPWQYTYRRNLCGTKQHSDANKQWHWSLQGERTRGAIKGGDWGSCHIGTFGKEKRETARRKKYSRNENTK